MRKQSAAPPGEEGLPEWLMSYADMITILMAFFVLMFAKAPKVSTASDELKQQAVFQSLRDSLGPRIRGLRGMGQPPYVPINGATNQLAPHPNGPAGDYDGDGDRKSNKGSEVAGPIGDHHRISGTRPGEPLSRGGIVYFSDGRSDLTPENRKLVELAADELHGKLLKIEIRGHTSRKAVGKGSLRDNWDLAYARCRTVFERLTELGIEPKRIRFGVSSDNEPPRGGEDAVAQIQADRVEIFLLNETIGERDDPRGSLKTD